MERVSQCTWWSEVAYDPSSYRVVFFSGSPIGIPFLEELHVDERFYLVWVVTQPAVPVGRGMKVKENPVKTATEKLSMDIPVATPPSLRMRSKKRWSEAKEFHSWLKNCKPDMIVVVAYWKILPLETLELPHFGTINVHGSVLPKYRWASPLQSVFLKDPQAAWVTIMKMSEWLDEWDILSTHPIPLEFDWTVLDLIAALKEKAPKYLTNTLWRWGKWQIDPVPQEESEVTFCWKIDKEDWFVDLQNDTIDTIYKKRRAYAMRPKIHTLIEGKRIIIEQIILDELLYSANKELLLVDMNLVLNESVKELIVKPEWKKSMSRSDYLLWYRKKHSN